MLELRLVQDRRADLRRLVEDTRQLRPLLLRGRPRRCEDGLRCWKDRCRATHASCRWRFLALELPTKSCRAHRRSGRGSDRRCSPPDLSFEDARPSRASSLAKRRCAPTAARLRGLRQHVEHLSPKPSPSRRRRAFHRRGGPSSRRCRHVRRRRARPRAPSRTRGEDFASPPGACRSLKRRDRLRVLGLERIEDVLVNRDCLVRAAQIGLQHLTEAIVELHLSQRIVRRRDASLDDVDQRLVSAVLEVDAIERLSASSSFAERHDVPKARFRALDVAELLVHTREALAEHDAIFDRHVGDDRIWHRCWRAVPSPAGRRQTLDSRRVSCSTALREARAASRATRDRPRAGALRRSRGVMHERDALSDPPRTGACAR